MSVLRILPKNLSDMIAAGEVVQRPASVVKELMENAVDAGATEVLVNVLDAGRTLVQVIDNGSGMSADDAVLCFERHATSKIASPEDLNDIETFGFRGEALASIAAVADVTLRTRRAGDEVGVEVEFAGSEHLSTREIAAPAGSNFAVRNLFFNVPARRKFLKSDNVEFRHILEEFQRVALTRPEIAFTLSHNRRDVHVLKQAPSLKFRIMDLMGAGVVGSVVDVEAVTSVANVEGFVGRPDAARKTTGCQFFFVNGRYFRSPLLHKAVMKAYENLIPEGYTPSYFIYLDVDPSTVDVNIHPTKAEIKFEEDQILFQTVFAAVKEALGKVGVAGSIEFDNPEAREIPVIGTRFEEYRPSSVPTAGVDLDFNPFEDLGPYAEPKQPKQVDYSSHVDKNQNYGALFEDRTLPTSQILIVQGKYILTQSAGGIMVVNIRRAQERLLHDRFLKALTANAHVSQAALFPVQVPVGVEGRLLIEEHQELLRSLGFDIAPFGNDTVVVSGVPEGYSAQQGEVETLMADVLLILKDENGALPGVMEQSLAQKFAVLGACSARNITSPLEAQRLVDALLQSENPEFTSAGKRILAIMGAEELEKRF